MRWSRRNPGEQRFPRISDDEFFRPYHEHFNKVLRESIFSPYPNAIEARVLSETVQGEFVPSKRTDIACQPSTDDGSGPPAAPQGPVRPDFDDLHTAIYRVRDC